MLCSLLESNEKSENLDISKLRYEQLMEIYLQWVLATSIWLFGSFFGCKWNKSAYLLNQSVNDFM